ncbi:MAG: hypothetical protein GY788_28670 [bacterium]|nr:hypothetical protein [bacterium]
MDTSGQHRHHDAPLPKSLQGRANQALISGAVRHQVIKTIRRKMKRRAAIKPVIGHVKTEHRKRPKLPQRM